MWCYRIELLSILISGLTMFQYRGKFVEKIRIWIYSESLLILFDKQKSWRDNILHPNYFSSELDNNDDLGFDHVCCKCKKRANLRCTRCGSNYDLCSQCFKVVGHDYKGIDRTLAHPLVNIDKDVRVICTLPPSFDLITVRRIDIWTVWRY